MKYRVIRSAAHNYGHSFTSLANYVGGDYVIGHLARAAAASGEPELRVDLLTGATEPEVLVTAPLRTSIDGYVGNFPDFLARHGIDIDAIREAAMRIRFDLTRLHTEEGRNGGLMLPFECVVEITDDRGKAHVGTVRDAWRVPGEHEARLP